MNFSHHTSDVFAFRDIRRYPNELGHVPNRHDLNRAEAGHGRTFPEVASAVNGSHGGEIITAEPSVTKDRKPFALWERSGVGFGDFIDIINPLHHIPIVATIYRNLSGDHIAPAPRVIGGALWGRIGGFVSGVANALVEWWSGKDIGDHVYAAIFGPAENDFDAAIAQKKAAPSGARPGTVARQELHPRGTAKAAVTSFEIPPADAPESDGINANAPRSEVGPLSRAARALYEKNRDWTEVTHSMRVRFPA
jgi:hypothetical protein